MIAVAEVTTLTSAFQLLNGPSAAQPTTKASRIETTGTPFLLVLASALGISRSAPSAYDSPAEGPTYTTPVPAGEITASTSRALASQPTPTTSAIEYHAPTADGSLPSGFVQPAAMSLGLSAPIRTTWRADRKSTRLNSSHVALSRMPSSA